MSEVVCVGALDAAVPVGVGAEDELHPTSTGTTIDASVSQEKERMRMLQGEALERGSPTKMKRWSRRDRPSAPPRVLSTHGAAARDRISAGAARFFVVFGKRARDCYRPASMGIVSWIVFGLLAGIVAKFVMPGKDGGGFITTTLLGILGAIVGGVIGNRMGWGSITGFNLPSFGLAVGGALVVLVVHRLLR